MMKVEKKDLKIALVHDFLVDFGGAERVLCELCKMFPDAPIYTLLANKKNFPDWLKKRKIKTSFLQKWPNFLRKRKKWLLPFLAIATETFDLREYDVVISSSGAWSKGIITRLNTIHIAYLHSPMRFVWDANNEYLQEQKKGNLVNFLISLVKSYVRLWDFVAIDRPDYLVANSQYTKERMMKYYKQEAEVIYPPVSIIENTKVFPDLPQNYFLIVSRLSAYKKVNVVVEAFNKLELPLVIVGEGKEKKYLKAMANKNIYFLDFQTDEKLAQIYAGAYGFIFPTVDDFGIAPVEAMLFGVPVLAIREGGVREIVLEGITGEFFDVATPEVLSDGVRRFKENRASYKKELIIKKAQEFSAERFSGELREFMKKVLCQS